MQVPGWLILIVILALIGFLAFIGIRKLIRMSAEGAEAMRRQNSSPEKLPRLTTRQIYSPPSAVPIARGSPRKPAWPETIFAIYCGKESMSPMWTS